MAKKVVASLKSSAKKDSFFAKIILPLRSAKTRAYSFKCPKKAVGGLPKDDEKKPETRKKRLDLISEALQKLKNRY